MILNVLTILLALLTLMRSLSPNSQEEVQNEVLAPFIEALQDDGEVQRPPDVIPTFPSPYGDPSVEDAVPDPL